MVEHTMQQGAEPKWPGVTRHPNPMAMCPMAKMCQRMMEKRPSGVLLMLPGALLIGLGVLILLEPRIVVWLVGTIAVLLGLMLLVMARLIDRSRVQPREM